MTVFILFQTDIHRTRASRVFFGVFTSEAKAIDHAKKTAYIPVIQRYKYLNMKLINSARYEGRRIYRQSDYYHTTRLLRTGGTFALGRTRLPQRTTPTGAVNH